ncbi:transposase [Vibrio rhizosphaerae]|uniref:Transposase n=1 Tax=Vibrio rhizosphaerae TaxID=398736 RepID=A0ABU4J0F9_9VIBR|nr:transposase [Vibrio rhizosphaerae]MDW6094628.1 transposase [Vibrio rhizosphaerae]
MTIARAQLVSLNTTAYYHCVSRCVRRAFLCGQDPLTGQSYEHRRHWVEQRILALAKVYCIGICAYAVMNNHYHLVVHINQEKAEQLSDQAVIERWAKEHLLPPQILRYLQGQASTADISICRKIIHLWRERLYSLSWFMKELNFSIARQANKEDQCGGHFWEGRFKSQALLDEKALLAAMAYTDLNPVRAGISPTPETSQYTSIKRRFDSLAHCQSKPQGLLPFAGDTNLDKSDTIPFRLLDYLEWVDWVGRQMREGKTGYIDRHQPAILIRLSLGQKESLELCSRLKQKRCLWIGTSEQLHSVKIKLNKQRIHGLSI